jgi:hypothetical protein
VTPGLTGIPVLPDADEARRWARDELADEVYRQAEPGFVARAVQWLLDRLTSIDVPDGPGSRVLLVLLLLLLAAAVVVAIALAGPVRLRRARRSSGEVFDDPSLSAQCHRRAAAEHAAAGRWAEAVREQFRAMVRSLEERALLTPTPGRTADEVAREAGALLPAVAADLASGALLFDDIWYGDRPATALHHAELRALDDAVAAARPDLARMTS